MDTISKNNDLDTKNSLELLYIQSLTLKEHKAYLIAQSHLGMSFDLRKSRGFIEWQTKHISDTSTTNI
jgi:hypothetical protein